MNNVLAVLLIMAVPMLGIPATVWADMPKSVEASESAKRRTERERQFLYREVEDLTRSQGYVQAAVRGLEKQIDTVEFLDPSKRERDIRSFLEWYRSYAGWLANKLAESEDDLSRAYSDQQRAIVHPERCDTLVDGYARLGAELDEQVSHLEKSNDTTLQRIAGLRRALEYITSLAFIKERNSEKKQSRPENERREERNREKKRSEQGNDGQKDALYEQYKDITEIEISLMQRELKYLDELQKHYLVLIEMGRLELFWISRKTGDYDALGRLAGVVGRDASVPIEKADSEVIKRYDSDIAYFKRQIDAISLSRSRLVPAGSMRILDRMEELTEKYDQMKYRYERHISWLAEQKGAYHADIVQLRKDK